MRKFVPLLAVAFVLFLVFTTPTGAGVGAAGFADFVGMFFSAVVEFMRALLGSGEAA